MIKHQIKNISFPSHLCITMLQGCFPITPRQYSYHNTVSQGYHWKVHDDILVCSATEYIILCITFNMKKGTVPSIVCIIPAMVCIILCNTFTGWKVWYFQILNTLYFGVVSIVKCLGCQVIGYSLLWITTKCHMPTINFDAVKLQELPSFVLKEQNTSMPSMERKKPYLSLVFIINQQTMNTFIGHYNI